MFFFPVTKKLAQEHLCGLSLGGCCKHSEKKQAEWKGNSYEL